MRLESGTTSHSHTIYADLLFHVVYENATLEGGYIPQVDLHKASVSQGWEMCREQQIKNQIDVLNEDYGLTGIRWKHTNTTRTKNSDWFNRVAPEK